MVKKIAISLAVLVVLAAMAVTGAVYVYGPTYGAVLTGKPIFMGHVTPKRYAHVVLGAAETAIYVDSPAFAAAADKARAVAKDATGNEELYGVLNDAVKAAGGKHSMLLTPAENAQSDAAATTNPARPVVDVHGRIAVATVPAVAREEGGQVYADTLAHGLADALGGDKPRACAAVVDLRGNTGGDMGPMVAGLSPLLPEGSALHFVGAFGENPVMITGDGVKGGGTSTSVDVSEKFTVPVAVLVDEKTASSGEATMLAFRGLDNSRSFGTPTAGYASANTVIDYPDGSELMLTISRDKARTGEIFAEDPIQPDVVLDPAQPADAADPIPPQAAAWLAEQGCR